MDNDDFKKYYESQEADEDSIDLKTALRKDPNFTPLVAYTLMVFVLLYVPCFAAMVVFYRESGSLGWTGFYIFYSTAIAYVIAFENNTKLKIYSKTVESYIGSFEATGTLKIPLDIYSVI